MADAPQVILCADDYAQTARISAGIRKLAEAGRLSATSAMTNAPPWTEEGPRLAPLRERFAVGLHLTLTHGAPLGPMPRLAPGGAFPSLGRVLALALTGRLRGRTFAQEIADEIERQLDAFETVSRAPPDHVDGHQHVHVLPGIVRPLVAALAQRYPGRQILLRDPRDRPGAILARGSAGKAAFVAALASGLGREAQCAGLVRNKGFSGFSKFGTLPYASEFTQFLTRPGPRPMVMCHPGEGDDPDDPIASRRPDELAFLLAEPGLPDLMAPPRRGGRGARVDGPAEGRGDG